MARCFGVPRDAIAPGCASFPGLPHRQQRVATIDGITFVNDSKATNADAAARALACYDRLVWIAGGLAKEGGIEPLALFFPRIARAFLIGRDAPMLAATLAAHDVPYDIVGTLDAAVAAAVATARATAAPVVLLSPACASFDNSPASRRAATVSPPWWQRSRRKGRPDANALARRQLAAGPLVVDR